MCYNANFTLQRGKTTMPKPKIATTNIATMKIIAGKFRGKILHSCILPHTRPTKAIVKESVFNTLSFFIKDKIFIEIFAGYGSMGFEALSRGAKRVIFLEKDKATFKILQKNIAMFGSEKDKILAKNIDSFEILSSGIIIDSGDILYFDPPFGENGEFYKKIFSLLEQKVLETQKVLESPNCLESQDFLESQKVLESQLTLESQDFLESPRLKNAKNAKDSTNLPNLASKMLIFEHISSFQMPNFIAKIPLQKCKKFGKTSVSYYFMA